jgi:phosphate transport system permease protein
VTARASLNTPKGERNGRSSDVRPKEARRTVRHSAAKDEAFRWLTLILALCAVALLVLIAIELTRSARPSILRFGWGFVASRVWDPVREVFGALPFIFGTVVSSALALLIAVPLGLGAAVWLVEMAPRTLRAPVGFLIELLAGIPSVIYGLWGIFVLIPVLRDRFEAPLAEHFPNLPLLSGQPFGIGMLAGGLILAIMVIPFITSVSQQVLMAVPDSQRQAALSLGATKWEMIRTCVLPYARSGITGAVMLGLGRALGETMAITMVIGNVPAISSHLFDPGYTMASVLANEFSEATSDIHRAALIEIGLLLFVLTIIVNIVARLLIRQTKVAAEGG